MKRLLALLLFSPLAFGAAPTVDSIAVSLEDAANVTSHTILIPTFGSCQSGDTIVSIFNVDGDNVAGDQTITWPMGWTEIVQDGDDADPQVEMSVAWRESDGTESGTTIEVTTGESQRSTHRTFCIISADDPDTNAPEAQMLGGTSSVNPDPPSITPSGGAADYLYIAGSAASNGQAHTAGPSGYANFGNVNGGAANVDHGSATLGTTGSSSEDPGTFTLGIAQVNVTVTIAVYPAVAGSGAAARRRR